MTCSCVVCGAKIEQTIYESSSDVSLTSLLTVQSQPTVVYGCGSCGHLQSPPLSDLDTYYGSNYRILIDSDEEDQLYAVVDGRPVFRADHQADTLLARIVLTPAARILDYGAAKGATMRRLMRARPDILPHFFDISDLYVSFWQRLVRDRSIATHVVPQSWTASFDVVASFFVLEHVERPVEVLARMRSLLKPGGVLYLIVPNPAANSADFVVVDHVNHFTGSSLERAFLAAGVDDVSLSAEAHNGAWLATGRRPADHVGSPTPHENVAAAVAEGNELARYWSGIRERVREAERMAQGRPAAIYGAGFYGSFIRSNLEQPEQILAYVDQNPFLWGTEHFDRPVVSPRDLDPTVEEIFVGLNPRMARSVIESVADWQDRAIHFHYL